ncbi:MAG: GlsB/YeaQ/YmgE family stress response membrane protein [Mycobacteriales bacterium]|jgi:uncharacterized membrane protein YeaQ/YmgE (transglycosylase-associated protein family)
MIGLIISYIIIGLIVGALARLVIPGRQSMGIGLTIALGVVGAVVGGLITRAIVGNGHKWISLIVSVAVAALLVYLVSGMQSRNKARI